MSLIRIFAAYKDFPAAILSKQEAEHFLTSDKQIVHVRTVDNSGEPDVRPMWYFFDASNYRLYVATKGDSKIVRNLAGDKTVYFCVDDPSLG